MKDLGIIKEREDFFRNCHNYISYGTLKDGAENDEFVLNAIGHHAYAFGYSDYGGDEFDNLCCDGLQKYPDAILDEQTAYNGRQTIVFGEIADLIANAKNDPYEIAKVIGFDLDEKSSELENKFISDATEFMLGELKRGYVIHEGDSDWLYNWLTDHGRPTATGWDFNSSDCEDAFAEYKGVDKTESVHEDTDVLVARLIQDEETGVCSLLMSNGDSIDISSADDAIQFCEKNGVKLVTESTQSITEGALDDFPTALEYGMVVARERAKDIIANVGKLKEIIDKYVDVNLVDVRIDALNIVSTIERDSNLIIEMSDGSKDKLANAEKSYADDMKLVQDTNN